MVALPTSRVFATDVRAGHLAGAGGVTLVYDRHPPQQASRGSVLFAHGFGQTRRAWDGSARALAAAGFEAIAADGRGHGQSGWNPDDLGYDIEQFVDDARALANVAATRPVWVGASMGGLLGLVAAGESAVAPYAALVLVDVTPRWEQAGVDRIIGFMRAHPGGFDTLDAAADAISTYLPHRPRKTPEQLSSLLVQAEDGRWRWHWDPRLLDELAQEAVHWQDRLAAAARRLAIPTLLVSGGRSDLVSDDTVREFLALTPHAAHVRIADATHMVAGDRNDIFTDTILDFLSRAEVQRAMSSTAADHAPRADAAPHERTPS